MSQRLTNLSNPRSVHALAVIPARYGSTRFPGKPLALIGGRPMIEYVYTTALEAVGAAVVATDDERVFDVVTSFGGRALMTSASCPNGTARVAEAICKLAPDERPSIVLNVQGDEPMVSVSQLRSVLDVLERTPEADIGTLALQVAATESYSSLADPNRVKMVLSDPAYDPDVRQALYFSRSVIPYVRDCDPALWPRVTHFHIHIGIYAFRAERLASLVSLPPTALDKAENLEQLRWLAHGRRIVAAVTDTPTHPVDTPADLEMLNAMWH